MNTHKNARLTYLRRLEMVQDITERGLSASEAGTRHGVSAVTARKWLGRYLADGSAGLLDKSSRPEKSPRAIEPHVALAIVELRRKLYLQAHIASYMGVSKATVSRVLKRAGLSRLSDLRPCEPVQRYERDNPGELLHIDIKKLGRFDKVGHRITGDRTQRARNIGWEHVFVAVDDHSRVAFTQVHPDEQAQRRGVPALGCRLLRAPRGANPTGTDGQRQVLPLRPVRCNLPRTGHQSEVHPRLPAADQRQSRALHPVGSA